MHALDPMLVRLREIEARIALAESLVEEQSAMVQRLSAKGYKAELARELLQSTQDALRILRDRQQQMMRAMELSAIQQTRSGGDGR